MSLFTEIDNPIHGGNKKLLEFIKKAIVEHEDTSEDCSCDYAPEFDCWYHMSDKEQMGERIDALFVRLTQEVADGFPNLVPTES